MTKERVEELVKRYPFVIRAIREGKRTAEFQISKRKFQIEITEEDVAVCEIYVRYLKTSARGNGIRMCSV